MKLTVRFLLLFVTAFTVYDVWTLAVRGYDTTVSWVLYQASQQWPIIPFALGVLAGHLFFPNRASKVGGK